MGSLFVTAFCNVYIFDEKSVREVRSKPLTIAPNRQRARNNATADPHLWSAGDVPFNVRSAYPTYSTLYCLNLNGAPPCYVKAVTAKKRVESILDFQLKLCPVFALENDENCLSESLSAA